jgi:hypothetical protein
VNATYARNDVSGSGRSRLWVNGNVMVYKGATLLMGCEPKYAPCTDDPYAATGGKLRVRDTVGGSVLVSWARGVDVYDSHIRGSVRQLYGGGGLSCAVPTSGVFSSIHARVSSAYEDDTIAGSLRITDLRTCWFGALRNKVHGSLYYVRSTLADGDASQVVSDVVRRALHCIGDKPVVQYADSDGRPNRAMHASGQCGFRRSQPNPAPGGPAMVISVRRA